MSDFSKNNDNHLRDKLTQHEFGKVPGAWENMEQMLNAQAPVKTGATVFWWALPVAAAAMMSGIIGLGIYLTPEKTSNEPITQPIVQQEQPLPNEIRQVDEKPVLNSQKEPLAKENNKAIAEAKPAEFNAIAHNNKSNKSESNASEVSNIVPPTQKENNAVNIANTAESNDAAITAGTETENSETKRIKKTRTIVRYQYSMTPLKNMLKKRADLTTKANSTIGTFGITQNSTLKSKPVRIGVFAGATGKMIGSTGTISVMPTAGITANYRFHPKHAIQAGLQYKAMNLKNNQSVGDSLEMGAYRYYHDGTVGTEAYSLNRVDMLELPIVYQFYPHPRFNVQAGVKGAWLFNKETSNPNMTKMSNKELGLVAFDIGMLFGMEVFINKHWSVGLQYSFGFINLVAEGQQMHADRMAQDPQHYTRTDILTNDGEALVPVTSSNNNDQMIRLPNELRNNDLQLHVKYTF